MNYRLGAFGWLGGDEVKKTGVANAALWDQRMALQWVQDHIEDFGGDPNRVTVMGESAGGGSLLHHITAFGGERKTLFQQAIPQSPGFTPIVTEAQNRAILDSFLGYANVTTLEQARALPSESLIRANVLQVGNAPYGSFIYNPSVDGTFVPDLPDKLLSTGAFHSNIRVLVGHNSDEGLLFTNPNAVDPATFPTNFKRNLPSLSNASLEYVTDTLYPAVFNGSAPYTDDIARQALASAELGFTCNAYALATYVPVSYAYEFSVFPGLHGFDVPYTFYNGADDNATAAAAAVAKAGSAGLAALAGGVQSLPAALALQDWITSFVIGGAPVSGPGIGGPAFPAYGRERRILDLVTDTAAPVGKADDISAARCKWWNSGRFVGNP